MSRKKFLDRNVKTKKQARGGDYRFSRDLVLREQILAIKQENHFNTDKICVLSL